MLRDTQLLKIFSVIKDIIYKMGQVCLETQIALAIQFLLIVDQKLENSWKFEGCSVGVRTG